MAKHEQEEWSLGDLGVALKLTGTICLLAAIFGNAWLPIPVSKALLIVFAASSLAFLLLVIADLVQPFDVSKRKHRRPDR